MFNDEALDIFGQDNRLDPIAARVELMAYDAFLLRNDLCKRGNSEDADLIQCLDYMIATLENYNE